MRLVLKEMPPIIKCLRTNGMIMVIFIFSNSEVVEFIALLNTVAALLIQFRFSANQLMWHVQ